MWKKRWVERQSLLSWCFCSSQSVVAAFLVIPSPPGKTRRSDDQFSAFQHVESEVGGAHFSSPVLKKPFQIQHFVSLISSCVAVFCTTAVVEQLGIDRDLQLACGTYSKLI